jgi:hypothetical protein
MKAPVFNIAELVELGLIVPGVADGVLSATGEYVIVKARLGLDDGERKPW